MKNLIANHVTHKENSLSDKKSNIRFSVKEVLKIYFICLFSLLISNAYNQCPNTDITLMRQGQVDSFRINYPGCKELTHGLIVDDIMMQPDEVKNLDSLFEIERGEEIRLRAAHLSNLSLPNLKYAKQLAFENVNLSNLTGVLPKLDSLKSLEIVSCDFFDISELEDVTITGEADPNFVVLSIAFNQDLELCSINSLCEVVSKDVSEVGERIIEFNKQGCNTIQEIIDSCDIDQSNPSDALSKIMGKLNINEEYTLPTIDGKAGQVLVTNGFGKLTWQDTSSGGGPPPPSGPEPWIADFDQNTYIHTEEFGNNDEITFVTNWVPKAWIDPLGHMGIGEYPVDHMLEVTNYSDNSAIKIVGPGFSGEQGRLTFGDEEYVYIEETINDELNIKAENVTMSLGFGIERLRLTKNGTDVSRLEFSNNFGNTLLGLGAGSGVAEGYGNTYIGHHAGSLTDFGAENVAVGQRAMQMHQGGNNNVAIGDSSLNYSNSGHYNTAIGANALLNQDEISFTTAVGGNALVNNVSGEKNTAVGYGSLFSSNGDENTAVGHGASASSSSTGNTAVGFRANYVNSSGAQNTSLGWKAGYSNLSGSSNVFVGAVAGEFNLTGSAMTIVGANALQKNTVGREVTAVGTQALYNSTVGDTNTVIGVQAAYTMTDGSYNTILGYKAGYTTTGHFNVFLGHEAGYNETGSSKLYISNSNTSTPLIYGDFGIGEVHINDVLKITPRSTAPASPTKGMMYFDDNDDKLYVYDGNSWQACF